MASFGALPDFLGNPYVVISAIDVSAGIDCSRSGTIQTPAFVQVSASSITATGTSRPYEDLEFTWDFGDLLGVEVFADPFGNSVNANSAQRGPEAAYVYRAAGTYIVTLTVRGKNGGVYVTAQKTLAIVVQAFNASGGTFFFNLSTSGAETGSGTQLSPYISSVTFQTKLGIANTILLHKCGSSFSRNTRFEINASPMRIGQYGTGSNPVLIINDSVDATQGCVIILRNGSSGPQPKNDVVISAIDFKRTGATGSPVIVLFSALNDHTAPASHSNLYLDNCNYISDGGGVNGVACQLDATVGSGATITGYGIWGGAIFPGLNDTSEGTGFFGGARNWTFIVGLSVSGNGGDPTRDHHLYPDCLTHILLRYIDCGDGPDRNYCFNNNYDDDPNPGTQAFPKYWLISDCDMTGVQRGFDAGSRTNLLSESTYTDFVVQLNAIHNLAGDGVNLFACAIKITFRNNRCWNNNGGRFWAPQASQLKTILQGNFYGNYIYCVSGSVSGGVLDFQTPGWTSPQFFAGNIIYNAEVTAKIANIIFADQVSAGSIWMQDQYWIPNDPDGAAWYNSGATRTFLQWQASGFDLTGSVTDPNWVDPANGNFSTMTPPLIQAPSSSPYLNSITTTTLRHRNFHVPEGYPGPDRKQASVYGHSQNQRLGSTFRSGSSKAHRIGGGVKLPPRRK